MDCSPHNACHLIYRLLYMLQVTFKSGYKIVLNRQNFEWNKSSFSEEFKATKTAGEFISVWNKVTKLDMYRGVAMPIIDSCSQNDAMSTSCSSSQGSAVAPSKHPLSDGDNSLPASKRPSSSSAKDHTNQHAHPIDDSILSKRIGDLSFR